MAGPEMTIVTKNATTKRAILTTGTATKMKVLNVLQVVQTIGLEMVFVISIATLKPVILTMGTVKMRGGRCEEYPTN